MGRNMGKAWSPLINRVSGANWVVWGGVYIQICVHCIS